MQTWCNYRYITHMLCCRLFNGRYNNLRFVALLLILVTSLMTGSLFYIFLSNDTTGGNAQADHVRYRHRLQNFSNTKLVGNEQLISGSISKSGKASEKQTQKTEYDYRRRKISPDVDDPLSIPRITEYCNPPIKNVTGDEGEAPPGYQLLSVQVLIRHGSRSPMYSFIHHPNPKLSCEFGRHFANSNPLVKHFIAAMQSNKNNQNRNSAFYQWLMFPQRKVCDISQLMASGAMQHVLNGLHFKEKYVKKWRLFGDWFHSGQIHVMSTQYSRTYQSAVAFLYGILPRFNLRELSIERSPSLYFCDERFIKTSCACPALLQLKKEADEDSSHINKNNTRLFQLNKYVGEVYRLQTHQLPSIWAMSDVFMAYACNQIRPPCNSNGKCINSLVMSELWNLLDDHGLKKEKLKSYRNYMRVTVHPFLVKILEQMIMTIKNKTRVKFSLFAGHDTTISPLAITLGFHEGKWPKLASRIVFELYSEQGQKDRHYIKILYNGKNVTPNVIFCKGHVVKGLCKLKHFTHFVREENLQELKGKTYTRICKG